MTHTSCGAGILFAFKICIFNLCFSLGDAIVLCWRGWYPPCCKLLVLSRILPGFPFSFRSRHHIRWSCFPGSSYASSLIVLILRWLSSFTSSSFASSSAARRSARILRSRLFDRNQHSSDWSSQDYRVSVSSELFAAAHPFGAKRKLLVNMIFYSGDIRLRTGFVSKLAWFCFPVIQ